MQQQNRRKVGAFIHWSPKHGYRSLESIDDFLRVSSAEKVLDVLQAEGPQAAWEYWNAGGCVDLAQDAVLQLAGSLAKAGFAEYAKALLERRNPGSTE